MVSTRKQKKDHEPILVIKDTQDMPLPTPDSTDISEFKKFPDL